MREGEGRMANKTVRNERRKLTATFMNGIAIALFAVGGLAQVASMTTTGRVSGPATFLAAVCILVSVALHLAARASLGGMED